MISHISINGFQSHVNSEFMLESGLNVITGPSDSGKTAIIRAIRWVAFNEPQGEAFINETVGEAEVIITLRTGEVISKNRRKGKTTYSIEIDGHISRFEKSEVPIEVTRLLGIEKHHFGDFESSLNFSFQLDAPFLISETGSAGAKVLGKLAGTESVDLAIKGVSKDTHAVRQMRSQAEKDMERITGSLLEYQGIDDDKERLDKAISLFRTVEQNKEQLTHLKEHRQTYLLSKDKIEILSKKLHKFSRLPLIEEDLKNVEEAQQRYDKLLQLYSDAHRLYTHIDELDIHLKKFEYLKDASIIIEELSKAVEKQCLLNTIRKAYQKYTDEVNKAEDILNDTKNINEAYIIIESIDKYKQDIKDLNKLKIEYQYAKHAYTLSLNRTESFKKMDVIDTNLNDLGHTYTRLSTLKEVKRTYDTAYAGKEKAKSFVKQADEDLKKYKQVLDDTWEEAGGVCPVCDQTVKLNHRH